MNAELSTGYILGLLERCNLFREAVIYLLRWVAVL